MKTWNNVYLHNILLPPLLWYFDLKSKKDVCDMAIEKYDLIRKGVLLYMYVYIYWVGDLSFTKN